MIQLLLTEQHILRYTLFHILPIILIRVISVNLYITLPQHLVLSIQCLPFGTQHLDGHCCNVRTKCTESEALTVLKDSDPCYEPVYWRHVYIRANIKSFQNSIYCLFSYIDTPRSAKQNEKPTISTLHEATLYLHTLYLHALYTFTHYTFTHYTFTHYILHTLYFHEQFIT